MGEVAGEASGPDELAESAEEVRAWLEVVRGGAPFLSGADGRLLVAWLDAGVPVILIQAAIDKVAAGRAARRKRSRLSLVGCRAEVERLRGLRATGGLEVARPQAVFGTDGFHRWVEGLASQPVHGSEEAWQELIAGLRAVVGKGGTADARAQEAVAACRRFHAAVWELNPDEQAARRQWATEQLDALRTALSAEHFAAAVEELARESVRARFPGVSASAVWDSLEP
jgi:hypothetical protein